MALNKLTLRPDQNGYSVQDGNEVLQVELEGGGPRQRLDVVGAWARVPLTWTTDAAGFSTLRAFYAANKGQAFLVDLVLESATATEHQCKFVPGSFRAPAQRRGKAYVVAVEVAVEPAVYAGP